MLCYALRRGKLERRSVKMAKLKANWILVIVCIIFVLSTFILLVQNGTLKAKANKLQADINNLSTAQEQANARLIEQTSLAASLQKELDEANATIQNLNNDKAALLGEIATVKKQLGVPPEIEILETE